ncbi:MAG: Hsp70 family protein [Planctomycetota bacterium]
MAEPNPRGHTRSIKRKAPTGDEQQKTRYVVGIDLGTTNTALAFVDRRSGRKARDVRPFPIEQLTEPGISQPCRTLPSALYLRGEHELTDAQLALPWKQGGQTVVGTLARVQGAKSPQRLITSAKSWLCHPGVDRAGAILPWGASEDELPKRSPVSVEAELLGHLAQAWDHGVAEGESEKTLTRQDVVITIPASFDEVARELTLAAAREAGFEPLLIEEPQAALYAWIAAHEDSWREELEPGETILVCDVGGGTTDFSLITVIEEEDGAPGFERSAVGDHLLLGGDNMDLALARAVEGRLKGKLDVHGWNGLVQACRDAKEKILEGETKQAKIAVAGRGSKLIGSVLRATVERAEVEQIVLEGFFPRVPKDEDTVPKRGAGLREFGLPYESEPAITRHLRAFLARQGKDGALAKVDHVLFNGGVFRTQALRERVLEVLATWQDAPHELQGSDLDLAVAHGAAYYGLVRRGKGTRIKSGAGRSYYVEVSADGAARKALCLIPRGLAEGGVVRISEPALELKANRPVVFPFHSSTNRDDEAASVVALAGDDFSELAPLHTVIRVGRKRTTRVKDVPVELVARYTELGTLEMWCEAKEGDKQWKLELDTRPREAQPEASAEEDPEGRAHAVDDELPPAVVGPDAATVDKARKLIITTLRLPAGTAQQPLEDLVNQLEEILGGSREGWPVPVIRSLFDVLIEERNARKRSPFHEARWLNLVGFFLRPGFGATLDFDRVAVMWKVFLEGMSHPNKNAVRLEWHVVWRRIAGGLQRGQQETIFAPVQAQLLGGKKGADRQELAELWRLAASLEHLSAKKKRRLGEVLLDQLEKGKAPPRWGPWAMARFGGRVPLYGPVDRLVSAETAADWLTRLLKLNLNQTEAFFTVVQLARLSGDRARDIPQDLRIKAHAKLKKLGADARVLRPLEEVVHSQVKTQAEFYGDSHPIGLVIKDD